MVAKEDVVRPASTGVQWAVDAIDTRGSIVLGAVAATPADFEPVGDTEEGRQ